MKVGDKVRFLKPVGVSIKPHMVGIVQEIRGDVLIVDWPRADIAIPGRDAEWSMFSFEQPELVE